MTRPGLMILMLALAVACSPAPAIPEDAPDLQLNVATPFFSPGKAFTLEVVRTWREDQKPPAWSDLALAPLEVRLEETRQQEDGLCVQETRQYQCRAFTLDDIGLPAMPFETLLTLKAKLALDPAAPGPAELPGLLLPIPFRWLPWTGSVALLALIYLAFTVLRYNRRRAQLVDDSQSEAPAIPPHVRALERLEILEAGTIDRPAEIQAFHVELAALVRDFLEECFQVCTPEMTTEEFLAAAEPRRILEVEPLAFLTRFLHLCDQVKFARFPSTAADRKELLRETEDFLRGSEAS